MSSVVPPLAVTVLEDLKFRMSSNASFASTKRNKPLSEIINLTSHLSIISKTNLAHDKKANDDDDRNPLDDNETFSNHFNFGGHNSKPRAPEMFHQQNDTIGKTMHNIIS